MAESNNGNSVIRLAMKNNYDKNNVSIRQALNSIGLDNSLIGWDGKSVTYSGKPVIVPEVNDNGTTKTNAGNFIDGVNRIYKNMGSSNSLADITKYAASNGIGDSVEYNNGNVSIGGISVPNTVIINGQAYAPSNDIKNTLSKLMNETGVSMPTENFNKYYGENGKYSSSIDNLIEKLAGRKSFEYDFESDPIYQSYKKIYQQNAQNAADDTYGKNAARTGGYGNSAAMAASAQAYYSYLDMLNDKAMELQENAYQRYSDDYESAERLLAMLGTPKDLYGYSNAANAATLEEIRKAMSTDEARNDKTYQNNTNEKRYNDELEAAAKEFEYEQNQNFLDRQYEQYRDSIDDSFKERELKLDEDKNSRENQLLEYEIRQLEAQIKSLLSKIK